MRKAYIAGPITGVPDYQAAFDVVAARWRQRGAVVINPATLPEGMRPADYMDICLSMVRAADVIVLLPGWLASPGARIERNYAVYIGKEVIEEPA